MSLSAEQFLRDKLTSEISSFGDGITEFHTRDLDHLLDCLDNKDEKIRELEKKNKELEEKVYNLELRLRYLD